MINLISGGELTHSHSYEDSREGLQFVEPELKIMFPIAFALTFILCMLCYHWWGLDTQKHVKEEIGEFQKELAGDFLGSIVAG